jgi:hypothetical protein
MFYDASLQHQWPLGGLMQRKFHFQARYDHSSWLQPFLKQMPENLQHACAARKHPLLLQRHPGYDHG